MTRAPADHGPKVRRRRGDVEIVARADPDAPHRTIQGARVRVLYVEAWARGSLTDAEREAADRYAVLCELASGARDRGTVPTPRVPPWQQGHPSMSQIDAEAELRAVHEAVGRVGMALLRHYVRDNRPLAEAPAPSKPNADQCMGWLRAALRRAAEAWGMED